MTQKLQQALELHRSGEISQAHDIYSALLEENPNNAGLIYLISHVALKINKHLDAVNLLVHALRVSPKEPLYLFMMGYLSQELDWKDQTIESYQRAIVLKPDFVEALSNLGRAYTEYNQYEDAMRCYKAAINIKPKTYAAYVGLALTLKRMGLENDAQETLEIALKLQPALIHDGENAPQTLERLNTTEPLLYLPPVMLPEETTSPEGAPHIAKPKPKLRIIHQLPMSGGSIITKSIAVLPDVAIFNNIHPRNAEVPQFGQNIFQQADGWYQLFTNEDKEKLSGQSVDYAEGVRMIYDRLQERGKTMLLRSWAHLDFIGQPFVVEPRRIAELTEILKDAFTVIEAATTRHPIENWLTLQKLQIMQKLSLDEFVEGYKAFAEHVAKVGYIRREDFGNNPDAELKKLCNSLELPFSEVFRERWKFEKRITLEPGDDMESIKPTLKGDYDLKLLEAFEAQMDYWSMLKLLGYQHPETPTTSK